MNLTSIHTTVPNPHQGLASSAMAAVTEVGREENAIDYKIVHLCGFVALMRVIESPQPLKEQTATKVTQHRVYLSHNMLHLMPTIAPRIRPM